MFTSYLYNIQPKWLCVFELFLLSACVCRCSIIRLNPKLYQDCRNRKSNANKSGHQHTDTCIHIRSSLRLAAMRSHWVESIEKKANRTFHINDGLDMLFLLLIALELLFSIFITRCFFRYARWENIRASGRGREGARLRQPWILSKLRMRQFRLWWISSGVWQKCCCDSKIC